MEQHIQVGVISSDPLRLLGLQTILEESAGIMSRPARLEEALKAEDLSAVLLDSAGAENVTDALERFRRERPAAKVVVVGDDADADRVQAVITAGARGYLQASADEAEIRMAMQTVMNGAVWAPKRADSHFVEPEDEHPPAAKAVPTLFDRMTPREGDVLRLLLNGRNNQQIAEQMGIGAVTVKAHMGRMLRKAGVKNRVELTLMALAQS